MSEVEFVGGHATEQTTEADPGVYENENKEAAKEAVRKALAKEAKKPKAESDETVTAEEKSEKQEPAAKTKPKKEPSEEAESEEKEAPKPKQKAKVDEESDEDPDALKLKNVLSKKEATAQAKKKEAEERSKWQQDLEARERQFQEREAALQRELQKLQRLKENPVEAVREAGWDPEEFITNLAMDGTPEGKAEARIRQMQAQIAEQNRWREDQLRQQEAYLRHQQEQQARSYRQNIEGQFLQTALKQPLTAQFYKGREAALIAEGDMIAMQYRKLTGGREASVPEIAEYIEQVLAERAEAWYQSKNKKQTEETEEEDSQQVREPEPKPEGVKKAGKTLNPDNSGERRALSKRLDDMDEDERKEVAKQEVRKALNRYKKPTEDD